MTSLNEKLRGIRDMFGSAVSKSYHYRKSPGVKPPYAVWKEDGEDEQLYTDSEKVEQSITGSIDFFTLREFDPLIDTLQETLNTHMENWTLVSVDYEDETKLIHYSWEWSKL